jgi:hypothetical protein
MGARAFASPLSVSTSARLALQALAGIPTPGVSFWRLVLPTLPVSISASMLASFFLSMLLDL